MQLPHDLKSYRSDRQLMKRLAITLSSVAAVMLFVTGSRMAAPRPSPHEPTIDYQQIAAKRTGDLVWLMKGETHRLIWIDPHTGMNKVIVCEVHETGFVVAQGDRQ